MCIGVSSLPSDTCLAGEEEGGVCCGSGGGGRGWGDLEQE